jgi:hypothetical protein
MILKKEKFRYEFDDSLRILFKYYDGSITLDDIKFSWEYAFANNLISRETRGFILDYRKATFNMDLEEHDGIAKFYQEHLEVFGNFKIAILTDNPKDVVIPTLVELKDDGYQSKPFCNLDAAIDWVLS